MNIVAWASSEEESANRVKRATTDLDCILLELEHMKLLEERMEEPEYPEELIEMRVTAQRRPDDIVFGDFHVWVQDDAN